jgi:hypothetical protein
MRPESGAGSDSRRGPGARKNKKSRHMRRLQQQPSAGLEPGDPFLTTL